jgi:hypothetical protein
MTKFEIGDLVVWNNNLKYIALLLSPARDYNLRGLWKVKWLDSDVIGEAYEHQLKLL